MMKSLARMSSCSRDSAWLYQERFPHQPQLSLWRGAEKALVTTGFFWSGQVFQPLTMLGDWGSLPHWCPSSSTLSLWASLLPLPRNCSLADPNVVIPVWLGKYREAIYRGPGEMQTGVCSGGRWHAFLQLCHFCCDEHHSKVGTVTSFEDEGRDVN